MEPTAYCTLALAGAPGGASQRGWQRMQQWARADGGWSPSSAVSDSTWVTALGLLVYCCFETKSTPVSDRSVAWLMSTSGHESAWNYRLASFFHLLKTDLDVTHRGWPWYPGNSSWVEPTALALLALKKSTTLRKDKAVMARIDEGERMLLSRRGQDGGWNCGNSNVLGVPVPSYPESTAIALIGLQGCRRSELAGPVAKARQLHQECKSSLAKAWLTLAFECHGELLPTQQSSTPTNDILTSALQALSHPQGNHHLLRWQPVGSGRAV